MNIHLVIFDALNNELGATIAEEVDNDYGEFSILNLELVE